MLSVHATGPGGWLTVAVPGVCLLVETPATQTPHAEALLDALRSADPIPAALDLLTAGGFAAMPAFALLEHRGQSAHFVVRGGVELAFTGPGGERSASGEGITTWSEQLISGVDSFTISASDDAGDDLGTVLPLADGAAFGDRVVWRATDAAGGDAVPETRAAPAPQRAAPPTQAAPTQAASASAPHPAVAAQDARAPETAPVSHATLLPTALPEDSMPAPEGTTGYDHLFGVTMMKSVESAAVRPRDEEAEQEASAAASDPDLGDHDGLTMMSGDIAALRERASAARGGDPVGRGTADAEPAAPATGGDSAEPQFRLELPDGRSELLDRPVVIGRSPSASKVAGGELPRLIRLGGSDPDISRSHVRFTVEGGTVVITDLHSRNGTLMALPGRAPQKLREGEPTSALAGTVVDLGGGIRITVTEVGSAAEH